jgi:hypothetical protein
VYFVGVSFKNIHFSISFIFHTKQSKHKFDLSHETIQNTNSHEYTQRPDHATDAGKTNASPCYAIAIEQLWVQPNGE